MASGRVPTGELEHDDRYVAPKEVKKNKPGLPQSQRIKGWLESGGR